MSFPAALVFRFCESEEREVTFGERIKFLSVAVVNQHKREANMSSTLQKFILCVCMFFVFIDLAYCDELVSVLLTGPEKAAVGDSVAFEVELVNRSGKQLSQLRVVDYFDKGLRHPVSASPIEQSGTIVLAAGTSRRLTLEFQVVELGRQCHRVEILDQTNTAVGSGTACVEAVPPNSPAAPAPRAVQPPGAVQPFPIKLPESQSAGPLHPALKNGPPNSVPQPLGSRDSPLSQLPTSQLPTSQSPQPSLSPQSGNVAQPRSVVDQTDSNPVDEKTVKSEGIAKIEATSPRVESSPVPIVTPLDDSVTVDDSVTALPPNVVGPNVASLSTATQASPAFQVALAGPSELNAGGVGEFVVTIENTGTAPSTEISLEVMWDSFLTPLEASDGYVLDQNKATWSIPPVAINESVRRQINVRGVIRAGEEVSLSGARACVRTVLSDLPGGAMVADEKCVVVKSGAPRFQSPAEAGLCLNLADLDDPVRAGGGTTLICTVLNRGDKPSGTLKLVIRLPEHARLVGNPMPSRVRIDGSEITFDGIHSLAAGGRSTFELIYRLPAGESGEAKASLGGENLDGNLEAACKTTFLPL